MAKIKENPTKQRADGANAAPVTVDLAREIQSFDFTQGRDLYPLLARSAIPKERREYLTKVATAYAAALPSLASLLFPRKVELADASRKAYTLEKTPRPEAKFIAALVDFPDIGNWDRHRDWHYIGDKHEQLATYSRHLKRHLFGLYHATNIPWMIERSGITRDNLTTLPNDLDDTYFKDASGFVIAENWNHFLRQFYDLHNLYTSRIQRLAEINGIDVPNSETYLSGFHDTLGYFLKGSLRAAYLIRDESGIERAPAAMLKSLADAEIQQTLNKDNLSSDQARVILDEIAHQLFGFRYYGPYLKKFIEDEVFCDEACSIGVTGAKLIQSIEGDQLSLPKSDSRIHALNHDLIPFPRELAAERQLIPDFTGTNALQTEEERTGKIHEVLTEYPALYSLFYPRKVEEGERVYIASQMWQFDSFKAASGILAALVTEPTPYKSDISEGELHSTLNAVYSLLRRYINGNILFSTNLIEHTERLKNIKFDALPAIFEKFSTYAFADYHGFVISEGVTHLFHIASDVRRLMLQRELEALRYLRLEARASRCQSELEKPCNLETIALDLLSHWKDESQPIPATPYQLADVVLPILRDDTVRNQIQTDSLTPENADKILEQASKVRYGLGFHQFLIPHLSKLKAIDRGLSLVVHLDGVVAQSLKVKSNQVTLKIISDKPLEFDADLTLKLGKRINPASSVITERACANKQIGEGALGRVLERPIHTGISRENRIVYNRDERPEYPYTTVAATVLAYPSLAGLFYPRKVRDSEKRFPIDSALLTNQVLWRGILETYDNLMRGTGMFLPEEREADLAASAQHLIKCIGAPIRGYLGLKRPADPSLKGKFLSDIATLFKELDGYVFTDRKGFIIAESLGQLLRIPEDIRALRWDYIMQAAQAEGRTDERYLINPHREHGIKYRAANIYYGERFDPSIFFNDETAVPAAVLPELNSEGLKTILQGGRATPDHSKLILNSAMRQFYGLPEYEPAYKEALKNKLFSDPEFSVYVSGEELISCVEGEIGNISAKVITSAKKFDITGGREFHRNIVARVDNSTARKLEQTARQLCKKHPSLHTLFFPRERTETRDDDILLEVSGEGLRRFLSGDLPREEVRGVLAGFEGIYEKLSEHPESNPVGRVFTTHDGAVLSENSQHFIRQLNDLNDICRQRFGEKWDPWWCDTLPPDCEATFLPSLGDSKERVSDIRNSALSAHDAQLILDQAAFYRLGFHKYTPELAKYLEGEVFRSPLRKYLNLCLTGKELIDTLNTPGKSSLSKFEASVKRVHTSSAKGREEEFDFAMGRQIHPAFSEFERKFLKNPVSEDLKQRKIVELLTKYPSLHTLCFQRQARNTERKVVLPNWGRSSDFESYQDLGLARDVLDPHEEFSDRLLGSTLWIMHSYSWIGQELEVKKTYRLNGHTLASRWQHLHDERYSETIFVDRDGIVVAESYGHLLEIMNALHAWTSAPINNQERSYDLDIAQKAYQVLLKGHDEYCRDEAYLRTFSHMTLESSDAILPVLWTHKTAIKQGDLSQPDAINILDEAVLELFGYPKYTPFFEPHIRNKQFSNGNNLKVSGAKLLDLAFYGGDSTVHTNSEEREICIRSLITKASPNPFDHQGMKFSTPYLSTGPNITKYFPLTPKQARAPDSSQDSPPKPSKITASPALTPAEQRRLEEEQKLQTKHSLFRSLYRNSEVPAGMLFYALCATGEFSESLKELDKFQKLLLPQATAESNDNETQAEQEAAKARVRNKPAVQTFSELLEQAITDPKKIDLSEVGKGRLADLFYQICFKKFDGDPKKIAEELEGIDREMVPGSPQSETIKNILSDIIPLLESRVQKEQSYRIPANINFSPFIHQLSWINGDQPIGVFGPGSGKTEMIALKVATNSGKSLVLTKNSNRFDTYARVAKLVTDKKCLELKPEDLNLPYYQFVELFQKSDAVFMSHPSIKALKNREDKYEFVKNWLNLLIVDEAHALDNLNSQLFKAIANLKASEVKLLTGTPVQHRTENLASLLYLVRPSEFPDPLKLKNLFKKDQEMALALYRKYAMVGDIEAISREFIPFKERPAEDQLSDGIPRIPKKVYHDLSFTMSAKQTQAYINLVLSPPKASDKGEKSSPHLRRLATIRRLLADPDKFDAGPALAMLQAVKEVAIPAMQRGEKVIILAQHLALLNLVASDPEIRFMGAALMTGKQSADERKEIIRKVSEDTKLMCVIGQSRILGTGHDLKGVEHIIILEPPHTVAEVIQGTNRHRRLITKATAHFAREEAHVHFVKPKLDLRVVKLVKSEEHRQLLERGSLYEFWMNKIVKKSESYSVLTSQVSRIRLDPDAGLASVVKDLATLQQELNEKREAFQKLETQELQVLHHRYRCEEKTAWREKLAAFTKEALPQLGKDRSDLRLALLPGPEGLELEPHITAGILPQNIYAFEADPSETVRDLCRKHVSQAGAHFFGLKMEQILPTLSPGVDIISYDTNSNTGLEFIKMLMSWQMPSVSARN